MINPALAFTLVALAMLVVNNGYADEKSAIDVKVVEFTQAEIASNPDDVVPESKASIAQENSLKQPDNKVVNVSDAKPKRETDLVDGLILNRAMTRFGHRFYREFVSAYRDINGMSEHSGLTIVEQATARSGSKILVLHNRKPIFVTFVSPASRNIDEQADMAAKRVNVSLLQYQQQAQWNAFSDPDLASDEF
ncbi:MULTISPECIES: curli production assembly/transport protein CsgE [Shewanella]|uniref:Curli production assembly/transport component CsgE n=1 Tax=Shewanella holmiensis TaxID=2952222 RepID=A0A9X3AW18_9GAMM|nr:curli production assembly/transport protein CsgE [Shewanella sp. ULN5]MCT7943265.1 curli production assembly/transport protein CsgE [Shewanella holmiensis]MDP5148099.1 curli production assembly/transport protein CsgE [Shewanella sp. ULN5]